MANNIDLTISALECPLGTFQCSAWLIQLRQRTALSPLKRSCSRFASLTLRTPHRPPVSSPLAAAAALWLPCVRGAVRRRAGLRGCLRIRGKGKGRLPSPVSAPNQLFELLRCSGRLIRQAETHDLQPHSRPPSKHTALSPLKRSCFSRFAASEPRTALPFLCAFLVGLFSVSAPNQLFKLLRCSAWLILRRSPTGTSAPKRSCFRFASLTPRTAHRPPVSLCFSPKTHDLQPLRGLHRSALRCLL